MRIGIATDHGGYTLVAVPTILTSFRFPKSSTDVVTRGDFPALIDAIMHECDRKLGPGAGSLAARPTKTSRTRG